MFSFSPGEIVEDSRGRAGIVLKQHPTILGNFYEILIAGKIETLPEEEIRLKNND